MTEFDRDGFAAAVSAVVESRGISDRAVCRECGLSSSTATRIVRQGLMPDVTTLVRLADWAGLSVDAFVVRDRPLPATPLVYDQRRIAAAQQAARAAAETLALILDHGR